MAKHPSHTSSPSSSQRKHLRQQPEVPVRRRKSMNGAVLDVSAASLIYGLSERALWGLIARATIPSRKLQSRVVFLRSELDQFFSTLPGVTLKEALENAAVRRRKGGL